MGNIFKNSSENLNLINDRFQIYEEIKILNDTLRLNREFSYKIFKIKEMKKFTNF